jgi:regulator of nucleoside diphosphate kinase
MSQPAIRLTEHDHAVLSRLIALDTEPHQVTLLEALDEELQRATLVSPHAAAALVQLGSEVTWETHETGQVRTARLVLPAEVKTPGELSVLTPVGCALIGLREGDVFTWANGARQWRLRVVRVRQPTLSAREP